VEVGQPAVVGPAHQQVADIDDELGRGGVDVDPVPGPCPHLEPARNVLAAQDGEAPIVGVGADRYLNPDLPDRAGLSRVVSAIKGGQRPGGSEGHNQVVQFPMIWQKLSEIDRK
jgi:hypothetical protein